MRGSMSYTSDRSLKRYGCIAGTFLASLLALPIAAGEAVNLFVLAGQSNMAGKAVPGRLVEEVKPFPAHVRLHTKHGWGPLRCGTTFGPEIGFGVAMARAWPDGEIGLIKYAVDGTSLATRWHPSHGDLYPKLIEQVRTATSELKSQGRRVELQAVLWMQGESDMTRLEWANAYGENLIAFIKRLRSDLAAPELPFIYGFTFGIKYAHPDIVRGAQLELHRLLPATRLVYNDDLPRSTKDLIHLTEPGELELGRRFARAYLALHGGCDHDGDGFNDQPDPPCRIEDNCPTVYNFTQSDHDGDGIGDECDGGTNTAPVHRVTIAAQSRPASSRAPNSEK